MSNSWYSDLPQYYQRQIKALGLDEAGMTRRRMMKAMAATAGTFAAGSLIRPARAATSLGYMCWEGYNDPRIIDPFNAANDTDVTFDLIVDSPGGFAKLQAGASREIDVISSDLPWITRMGPAGLAMELDPADYANVFASFYDQFKPPFAPLLHEGKTIGVATRWGWVGPCLNTDFTDPEEWRSYDPVFDDKYKDKIAVMDWGDWPILPMALHAGIMRKVRRQALKDYLLFPALTGPLFPLTFVGNATANLVRNVWAFNIIFCGHFPAGAETFSADECEDETRGHWYYRQVLGSANISGGPLFHIMSGNLSHQIEHHLFPDLPARRYPQIAPEVREICERYGIAYTTGPLRTQLWSVAKKICRLALPDRTPATAPEPEAVRPVAA